MNKKIKKAIVKGFEATVERGKSSSIDPHIICSVEPLDIEKICSQYTKVNGSNILQQTNGDAKPKS